MTTREIIGKPVISMADGMKVGDVKDLLIDTSSLVATTLVLSNEEEGSHVPWEKLKSLGKDVITIDDRTAVQPKTKPVEPVRSFHELAGTTVVEGAGTVIGTLKELELDETGHIRTFSTKAGGVFGLGTKDSTVAVNEIRTIGPRLITVERTPPTVS